MRLKQLRNFIFLPVLLHAGGIPIGIPSQEITQLLNHAQLAMQYERQAQQIYNQVQMIRMMVQEGAHLQNPMMMSSMILNDISGLRTLVGQVQGLSYGFAANDAKFRTTYSGYAQATAPFFERYNNLAATTLNTALGAAQMAGMQQDQIWSEQQMNNRLQALMSTPAGRDQTLEIANTLSFSMVGQMQKLRSLVASDMQSKAAYSGYQISKEQAKELDTSAATTYVERQSDHRQYGEVPGVSH